MAPVKERVRIIGIDPGMSKCGYAVIDYDGRNPSAVEYGLIRTDPKLETPSRLREIIEKLREIIVEFSPDEFAIERVYFHRNVSTAIDVAMVMGAAIVLAIEKDITCRQYAPRQVKRAIVGTGSASKHQVQSMVERLYRLKELPKLPDVADALAVALTHAHLRNSIEDASVG
jgi:crossover junction endodeoxyribonuclease RuvC